MKLKELEYLKTIGDIVINKDGLTIRDSYSGEYQAIEETLEKLDSLLDFKKSGAIEVAFFRYSDKFIIMPDERYMELRGEVAKANEYDVYEKRLYELLKKKFEK